MATACPEVPAPGQPAGHPKTRCVDDSAHPLSRCADDSAQPLSKREVAMQREAKWQLRARKYRHQASPPGIPKRGAYIWRIRPQDLSRTRPDHLLLNGKEFRWEEPPVVNTRTGERGHPGMDTHCRCYVEPVAEQNI